MPQINWPEVPDANSPVPEGVYRVEVDTVNVSFNINKDEMWTVGFKIVSGSYVGRKIVDRLVWSEKAMPRVKIAMSALGIDTSGVSNVTPDDIKGKRCVLDVVVVEKIDRKPGQEPKTYHNNKVTFAGYSAIDTAHVPPPADDDEDLPF